VNVSGYIFGTNITGPFRNDTWVPFSAFVNATCAFANVTKTLNAPMGDTVLWREWCNDTGNNWNSIGWQHLVIDTNKVLLVTSMGNITIELFDDMPITTWNFRSLVKQGLYDETIFHRVIDNFMIQGGAIPDIPSIQDEFTDHNRNYRGTVAMANAGANTGSSQFFINLVDNNYLDDQHPVFGRVIAGMDVVDAIGKVATDPNNKPLQDVRIIKAEFIP
jgi:peptidylprolyl isomerase